MHQRLFCKAIIKYKNYTVWTKHYAIVTLFNIKTNMAEIIAMKQIRENIFCKETKLMIAFISKKNIVFELSHITEMKKSNRF